jgi:hypothetical protein
MHKDIQQQASTQSLTIRETYPPCAAKWREKLMLIEKTRDVYRELTGTVTPAETSTTVQAGCCAANAADFKSSEMQSRRLRRQRRNGRSQIHRFGGWAIRTW